MDAQGLFFASKANDKFRSRFFGFQDLKIIYSPNPEMNFSPVFLHNLAIAT